MSFVPNWREAATGLRFPEGPVVMADGSVLVVEIARGTLSRVKPNGQVQVVATPGGGPNGAAVGPDGWVYLCNNGGMDWRERRGTIFPTGDRSATYEGGRIERVNLATGKVEEVYRTCKGTPLSAPNDIVFDREGGFWFTDIGAGHERVRDRGALYYAPPGGGEVQERMYPMETPNGVGLSPDGSRVVVAESVTARVWSFPVDAPVITMPLRHSGYVGTGVGFVWFDSLAVEADGTIAVATILNGGITRMREGEGVVGVVPCPDPMTTNIAFHTKGSEHMAWVTLSSRGVLAHGGWPAAGAPLAFEL